MGRWGDGEMEKYLVMVEDGTFFYTGLNGFDIISCPLEYLYFGGRKAVMLKAAILKGILVQRDKVFITDYPNMI
ncbi:MAG: hypothetical protein F6K54_28820 [Okeania sp. SIO3B5]|uniref:hypothetical protein n=1 Tax=Okeania sp. SIO3B5 TaxID=2607811 RepID=UPI0014007D87|nr:hypothetical protein [Okeania sp. SIO3B5]NEO56728.1 hypothetical protein [Okeania sp. SIO3B5]